MPTMDGKRLGACEVISLIGAGGMGKVYRARDTRLGRDVAVKVLPEAFASDAERMARIEREARILASLNHPNIAAIHSLEEANGVRGLVMEYVDGPTLKDRMARSAIPAEEALSIVRSIAEALAYAHERGIIHRDLKPGNVKLTSGGVVKVLDFGLAKALHDEAPSGDPDNSPTRTLSATGAGVILGTAGYMSPEQARGKAVDKRADIWAFGVVLFEMLAGRRLFEGETVSETLASVMKEPIDWSALPPSTPPVIRRLLRRCLERDSKNRLHDIGDALLDLDEALEGKEERAATPQRRVVMPWILAVALAVLVGMVVLRWPERPVEQPLMRLELDLGPSAALASIWGPTAVLSPDGTRLVYIANGPDGNSLLMTRLVDRTEATPLPGTEGAAGPFFSPDGQWVAFHAGGKLKKISVNGGAAVVLCEAPVLVGGSWGEDGNIIAALSLRGLSRIPSAGSDPQPFTQPHESHRWPQILPGGDAVLFTAGSAGAIQDTASIVVQALNTGRRKVLLRGGYYGRYLPSGHLVYMQQGTLFAVGFDPDKWELVGRPVPVVDDIASYGASGGANFDFSRTGTFVYTSGRMASLTSSLMWLDGAGRLDPLPVKPATYVAPRLSPDGKRLAFIRVEAGGQGLWVYEWQRDIMQRLPVTAAIATPVWTPDGRHIVFTSGQEIQRIRADGSAKPQRLTDSKDQRYPFSFSPDGKTLAFVELSKETSWDIWTLPLAGDNPDDPKPGEPKLFLRTQFTEWAPAFSPDGRWLAYTSDESGNFGVYVQPFPQGGGRWLVSGGGGRGVIWSRTRAELFYLASGGRIMSAAYSVKGGSFVPAARRQWSERRLPLFPVWLSFDLAPDGNRMIFLTTGEEQEKPETHLTFLLNFFDELRRRVPAGGK